MPRSARLLLLGAIACLLATVPVAIAAYSIAPTRELDSQLLLQMYRPESSPVDFVGEIVVLVGELPVVIALLGGIVWLGLHLGRRRETIVAAVLVLGAGATTQILKHVFAHLRFQEAFWTKPQELAFPSGHTTAAAALSVALCLVVPPVHRLTAATVGLLVTAGVGISVVVIGWHYPSDVLGGLLVVGAWSLGALAYLRFRAARDGALEAPEHSRPRALAVSTD
jgi:membrane-associated phospholipid phosphatase